MTDPMVRIEAALGRLGAEHEPPVGWEARVLAAVNAQTDARPRTKWWWFAAPAAALAVIALLVFVRPPEKQPLQLAYTVEKSSTVVRGSAPYLGDVVHATATGGGPYRAIWIYRQDMLVVACPGAAPCRSSDDSTIADITVSSLGTYKIVALTSKSPLPVPTGKLDIDRASARDAGAMEQTEQFTVE